tara:strand:+ start:608 stop:1006 length:399 start_codon:yes stop_codon:yes gene_type:complete
MRITRRKLNEVIRQYLINEAEATVDQSENEKTKFKLPGISGELDTFSSYLKDPGVKKAFEDLTSQKDDAGIMKSLRSIAKQAKPGVQTYSALLMTIMLNFDEKSKKHFDMAERDDVINKAFKAEIAWRRTAK